MSQTTPNVRVRMAPAPTGLFHVGSARAALFNWLFARRRGGVFVLRIEDTDVTRQLDEAIDNLQQAMRWLGLDWDEGPAVGGEYGPYYQSQRSALYQEHAQRLLESGAGYLCFCSPEELEQRRRQLQAQGVEPKYDRRCRALSQPERERLQAEGRPAAIRFAMPNGETIMVEDAVLGAIEYQSDDLDDFVLLKSSGGPTYNLANVVDDHLMAISHVLRGVDMLNSTPRQQLVYRALGWEPPVFGHLPILLGTDRTKLSKRHGAEPVTWYRDNGYLPEAMINFLALLGWAPGEDRELLAREEMIALFSLENISKSPAVFDVEKLEWMNSHYLRACSPERFIKLTLPYLQRAGLLPDPLPDEQREYAERVILLEQEKVKTLSDIVSLADFFFRALPEYEPTAVSKWLHNETAHELLTRLRDRLAALSSFTAGHLEREVRALAEELGIGAGKVIHPTRVAVSGRTTGPGLFELLEVMGRERVMERLEHAAQLARPGDQT